MKRMTREREKRPLTMSYNGKHYQFPQTNTSIKAQRRFSNKKSDELFKILMIHLKKNVMEKGLFFRIKITFLIKYE